MTEIDLEFLFLISKRRNTDKPRIKMQISIEKEAPNAVYFVYFDFNFVFVGNLELEPTARAFRDWFLDLAPNQSFCHLSRKIKHHIIVAIDTRWQIVSREFRSRLLLIKYSSKVVLFLVERQHSTWKNSEEDTMLSLNIFDIQLIELKELTFWINHFVLFNTANLL
uniref:Uncharacterized protein n=1 Tax=Strigamia maritima TaxID=126957 RepID=T1JCE9_STRMM